MDMITLAAARKYVQDTANALGAVKGSPCTITSITEADDGIHIVFSWTGTDGTVATQTAIMPYVAVDRVAREAVETLREDMGEAIDTTVRSINGRKPDSVGNVALPLSVTGVPNTGSPHQVFVTDADGKPGWEDRTHYSERVGTEIVATTTVTIDTPMSDGIRGYIHGAFELPSIEELLTYAEFDVVLDEVKFTCGNYGLVGGRFYIGEVEDVPFMLTVPTDQTEIEWLGSNTLIAGLGTHTISIVGVKKEYHPLDPKYLPDSVKAQPDWNQSDPEAPDYVKNRTHYTETTVTESAGIAETEVTGSVTLLNVYAQWLVVGAAVRVYFDGTPYECPVTGANPFYLGDANHSAYPFYIMHSVTEAYVDISVIDDGASHTVSVYKLDTAETVKKIDEKYIPDSIQRAEDNVVIPSGKSLTLQSGATVNDEAGVLGGGGVQPDWNQNDETADDFIKNKPDTSRYMLKRYTESGSSVYPNQETGPITVYNTNGGGPTDITGSRVTTYTVNARTSITGPIMTASDYLQTPYIKLKSSTAGSSKYFEIRVDDSGTITATEITT